MLFWKAKDLDWPILFDLGVISWIPIHGMQTRAFKIRRVASFQVVGSCRDGRDDLCRRDRRDQGTQERGEFAQ
jgi:hypothetical protein